MDEAFQATPPQQEKSLTGIFTAFATEAVERFPHLKGRLLILNGKEKTIHGYNEDFEKKGVTPEVVIALLGSEFEKKDAGSHSSKLLSDNDMCVFLFINEPLGEDEYAANISPETEKHLLLVLDHELAHMALKDGSADTSEADKIIRECIADAYALIRHYQRFGADSDYSDDLISPVGRAHDMMRFADKNHFTTFVLEEIIKRKDVIDFAAMTPEQTNALAWRFAMEYAPAVTSVERLYENFSPLRAAYNVSADDGRKKLADIALDEKAGYFTLKVAAPYLRAMLDDKLDSGDEPIKLRGAYWDEVRQELKKMEFRLAQEEILTGMPVVAAQDKLKPEKMKL